MGFTLVEKALARKAGREVRVGEIEPDRVWYRSGVWRRARPGCAAPRIQGLARKPESRQKVAARFAHAYNGLVEEDPCE
jgi:hypothetical protein